jgi:non-specific serine/threonine protein kinase
MYTGRPLFPGKNNEDQLNKIFKYLGTPTEASWPGLTEYSEYKRDWVVYPAQNLRTLLPMMDPMAIDLLSKMLCYLPNHRVSAKNALMHPYFTSMSPTSSSIDPSARFPLANSRSRSNNNVNNAPTQQ